MNTVTKVVDRQTNEVKYASYDLSPKGNLQYSIDGKFLSDKVFDKKYKVYTESKLQNNQVVVEWERNKQIVGRDLVDTNNLPAFYTTTKRGVEKIWEFVNSEFTPETTLSDVMDILYKYNIKYHYWCMMD